MEIINTKSLIESYRLTTMEDLVPHLVENNLTLEDSDSMYDAWVNPNNLNDFNPLSKKELIRETNNANEVQLELNKDPKNKFSNNLIKQHSIQISLFESIVLFDALSNPVTNHWTSDFEERIKQTTHFKLKNSEQNYDIVFDKILNQIKVNKDHMNCGALTIEKEQQVIEKISGVLFNQTFSIDPIWIHKKTTIDAVKLILGHYSTEIVHHPKHKQTLWRSNKSSLIMAITTNKTYQINQSLFINVKQFEWPNVTLKTIQWLCPWQYLPIQGRYYLNKRPH